MSPTSLFILSLHDALPILLSCELHASVAAIEWVSTIYLLVISALLLGVGRAGRPPARRGRALRRDRKSTRLNSSHVSTSYAVFCLKKKSCRHCRTSRPPPT